MERQRENEDHDNDDDDDDPVVVDNGEEAELASQETAFSPSRASKKRKGPDGRGSRGWEFDMEEDCRIDDLMNIKRSRGLEEN